MSKKILHTYRIFQELKMGKITSAACILREISNEALIISFRAFNPKIRPTNMPSTIVLFIGSDVFNIRLTVHGDGANTNEIKPHLDLLNSVRARDRFSYSQSRERFAYSLFYNNFPKIIIQRSCRKIVP